jgi:hypothetical protein
MLSSCTSPRPIQGRAGRFTPPNRWSVLAVQLRELNTRTQHRKSKMKFSFTVYVDNSCSGSLPALDQNCLCVVEVLPMASEFGLPSSNASAYYPVMHRPAMRAPLPPAINFGQAQAGSQSSYYLHRRWPKTSFMIFGIVSVLSSGCKSRGNTDE